MRGPVECMVAHIAAVGHTRVSTGQHPFFDRKGVRARMASNSSTSMSSPIAVTTARYDRFWHVRLAPIALP
jgi:hypothetical protein